jgi:hypothetical protein
MIVWLDIEAPRYWWQQFDTYRIGVTKQSESTMHTILRTRLYPMHFETKIPEVVLNELNEAIENKEFEYAKGMLPESFLQRRIVCTNYKTLRHIVKQRRNHKLYEWQLFINSLNDLQHSEFVLDS